MGHLLALKLRVLFYALKLRVLYYALCKQQTFAVNFSVKSVTKAKHEKNCHCIQMMKFKSTTQLFLYTLLLQSNRMKIKLSWCFFPPCILFVIPVFAVTCGGGQIAEMLKGNPKICIPGQINGCGKNFNCVPSADAGIHYCCGSGEAHAASGSGASGSWATGSGASGSGASGSGATGGCASGNLPETMNMVPEKACSGGCASGYNCQYVKAINEYRCCGTSRGKISLGCPNKTILRKIFLGCPNKII